MHQSVPFKGPFFLKRKKPIIPRLVPLKKLQGGPDNAEHISGAIVKTIFGQARANNQSSFNN